MEESLVSGWAYFVERSERVADIEVTLTSFFPDLRAAISRSLLDGQATWPEGAQSRVLGSNSAGSRPESFDSPWNGGVGSGKTSDRGLAGDWRLLNIKELLSLVEHGQSDPALPSGHLA